jgi:hypothetical protein
LAGAPGHFFRTLTGVIVVGAVILNTSVARRMALSKPLGGYRRSSDAADAAIVSAGKSTLDKGDAKDGLPDTRIASADLPEEPV